MGITYSPAAASPCDRVEDRGSYRQSALTVQASAANVKVSIKHPVRRYFGRRPGSRPASTSKNVARPRRVSGSVCLQRADGRRATCETSSDSMSPATLTSQRPKIALQSWSRVGHVARRSKEAIILRCTNIVCLLTAGAKPQCWRDSFITASNAASPSELLSSASTSLESSSGH